MPEIITITSRENRRLADVKRVRDGKAADRIFIEGIRLAEEALRSDLEIIDCVVSTSFHDSARGEKIVSEVISLNAPIVETPDRLFSSLADTVNSQGVILIATRPMTDSRFVKVRSVKSGSQLFVFLHEINDPSNLGAVLRTAEAAGVTGVIVSQGSADAFSPKALRASMGSGFRVPVWDQVTLEDAAQWARENSVRVVAADISGRLTYTEVDWLRPSVVVFGSEANGLTEEELRFADEIITIPMQNGVESLNLAVSTGVILFEAIRQRSARTDD